MGVVETVLGEISDVELGFCQCHEHLFISNGYPAEINPCQRIDNPVLSAAELAAYKNAGGGALIDAQPVGCGRGAKELSRISQESGVHITASTGFHKMMFYQRCRIPYMPRQQSSFNPTKLFAK